MPTEQSKQNQFKTVGRKVRMTHPYRSTTVAAQQTIAAKFTREHIDERERVVNAAVAAGKIPPSRAQYYRDLYDASPSECVRALTLAVAALNPTTTPPLHPALTDIHAYPTHALSTPERESITAAKAGLPAPRHGRINTDEGS